MATILIGLKISRRFDSTRSHYSWGKWNELPLGAGRNESATWINENILASLEKILFSNFCHSFPAKSLRSRTSGESEVRPAFCAVTKWLFKYFKAQRAGIESLNNNSLSAAGDACSQCTVINGVLANLQKISPLNVEARENNKTSALNLSTAFNKHNKSSKPSTLCTSVCGTGKAYYNSSKFSIEPPFLRRRPTFEWSLQTAYCEDSKWI